MSDRLEEACTALETRIEAIESDVVGWRGQIEDIEGQIADAEDEIHRLRRKLDKLAALDEMEVDRLIAGEDVIKTPRMIEIERSIRRGLSWDEWAKINREYQREAEKQQQDLAGLIDEALTA